MKIFFLLIFVLLIQKPLFPAQIKLSLTLFEYTSYHIDGFENSQLVTSDFGLKILSPVSSDTLWGLGFSRMNARIKDGSNLNNKYEGVFSMIMFESGVEYSGFKITDDLNLILDLSVEFPMSGEGKVIDSNRQIQSKAKSVDGNGILFGSGIRKGNYEGGIYYKQNIFSFGELVNPNQPDTEISISFNSIGLYVGYIF